MVDQSLRGFACHLPSRKTEQTVQWLEKEEGVVVLVNKKRWRRGGGDRERMESCKIVIFEDWGILEFKWTVLKYKGIFSVVNI